MGSDLRTPLAAAVVGAAAIALLACQGSMEDKLAEVLATVAKSVTIEGESVKAVCNNDEAVEVPAADLELNFIGMAPVENLSQVARDLMRACEETAQSEKKAADEARRYRDEAKRLGLKDFDDKSPDELRGPICDALAQQLPRKGDARAEGIQRNAINFNCPDPGAPPELPTGEWILSVKGKGRSKSAVIRLDDGSEDRDAPKLAFRCMGGKKRKLEAYVTTPFTLHKRKNKKVSAKVGKRRDSFATNMGQDKKSVFFKDAKDAYKSLQAGDSLSLSLRPARGRTKTLTFATKGLSEAAKPLRKLCRF